MKSYTSILLGSIFMLAACSTDDDSIQEPTPQPTNVLVEFGEDFTLLENSNNLEVKLEFSEPAIQDGTIQIEISLPEGLNFYTMPSAANNIINLSVEKDAAYASFNILPDNDNIILGMKDISFKLNTVSEGFRIGTKKNLLINLIDDELQGKPKSFETVWENWKTSKTYIYGPDGKISKVEWRKETPNVLTGTDTYYYLYGKIARINYNANHDENYYWEGDKIRTSEVIESGVKTSFSEYEYNPEGYISSQKVYLLEPNGGYKEAFTYAYLYFPDGNIRMQITFIPDNSIDGYTVISQRFHDHYSEHLNWFPVNEIVPTLVAQKNLPGSYRIEENGENLLYNFSYQFNSEGKAVKRETNGEITTYTYY